MKCYKCNKSFDDAPFISNKGGKLVYICTYDCYLKHIGVRNSMVILKESGIKATEEFIKDLMEIFELDAHLLLINTTAEVYDKQGWKHRVKTTSNHITVTRNEQ